MPCNLDHALYGALNLTDEENESQAYDFALRYRDSESLKRHTNLGLCLP